MHSPGGDGAEVIYALRNNDNLAKRITNEIANTGQNTREYYQRRLPSDPSQDYYFILRDTKNNQSVIVEYGFLDSTLDDVNQLKNNWQEYAEAVIKAVADYAGFNYVPADTTNNYIVEKGDSLWSIAKKFGISVNELKALNNLSSNLLNIGQVLKIKDISEPSTDTPKENNYVVKAGDTLYSIARRFGVSVDEIKRINNLTSNTLSIGQNLIISSSTPDESTNNVYVVKAGDNLYSIARTYNTTVDAIKRLNNLSTNTLSIGQKLLIPSSTTTLNYTVKAGDNLYSIARKYDTTVDQIKRINNLTSNLLSIGQILILPNN